MADWVHCNLCFKQPGGDRKFSLTNCGHIYCEECLKPDDKTKCKMCGKEPVTVILLSAKMKPDVEIFFLDPIEISKKHQKQLLQVMDFQKNHRLRLTAHNRARFAQQDGVMQKAHKAIELCRDLEREIMVLKEENSYLKKLINSKGSSGHQPRMVAGQGMYVGSSGQRQGMVRTGYGGVSPVRQGMVIGAYGGPSPTQQAVGLGAGGGPSPLGGRSSMGQYSVATPPGGSFMCSGQKHKLPPGDPNLHLAAMQNRSGGFVGASRLQLRTPPSNGRMGAIPHTPSPNSLSLTPSDGMQAMTPCRPASVLGYSPMACSPSYGRRSSIHSAVSASHAGKIGLAFCPSSTNTPPSSQR